MAEAAAISSKPRITGRIESWLRDRVRRRRGPLQLPFQIEYRNIFILPTRFGWGFAGMLTLTTLGGLNFNNNLALLQVFMLATTAVMTTLLAHRNLAGLQILRISAEPVFAGEAASFQVFLCNPDDRGRYSVCGIHDGGKDATDLAASDNATLSLEQTSTRRGWMAMQPFRIETRFPLGLFRAWAWMFPEERCLVWPAPAADAPPLPKTGSGISGQARRGEGDELHSLREYRPGDPLKRVAWKTSARHDALFTRQMEIPSNVACELNWHLLEGLDVEQRLSVLTSWVIEAERQQIPYSLILPNGSTNSSLGGSHSQDCLQRLALYQP